MTITRGHLGSISSNPINRKNYQELLQSSFLLLENENGVTEGGSGGGGGEEEPVHGEMSLWRVAMLVVMRMLSGIECLNKSLQMNLWASVEIETQLRCTRLITALESSLR